MPSIHRDGKVQPVAKVCGFIHSLYPVVDRLPFVWSLGQHLQHGGFLRLAQRQDLLDQEVTRQRLMLKLADGIATFLQTRLQLRQAVEHFQWLTQAPEQRCALLNVVVSRGKHHTVADRQTDPPPLRCVGQCVHTWPNGFEQACAYLCLGCRERVVCHGMVQRLLQRSVQRMNIGLRHYLVA